MILFLLTIVLSVLLRFTNSQYPFGVFKFFFLLIVVERHMNSISDKFMSKTSQCLQTMNRVSKNVPLVWVYGRKMLRLPSIGKQGYHGNGRTFWPQNGLPSTLNKLSLIKSCCGVINSVPHIQRTHIQQQRDQKLTEK